MEQKDVSLPAIPIILDEPKNNIKKVCQKVKQPKYKLNLFAQLIGGEMENQSNIDSNKFYQNERAKILQEIED